MYQVLFQYQEYILKTLANRKRLEIVQLLSHGELSVSEIVMMLGIAQSNVSQHLAVLRWAGVVHVRKHGQKMHYSLKDQRVARATRLVREFLMEEKQLTDDILDISSDELYPVLQDPVCGMRLALSEAADMVEYGPMQVHFCGSGCKQQFVNAPKQYLPNTRKTTISEGQ